jgi:Zinc dependent phospholipase C
MLKVLYSKTIWGAPIFFYALDANAWGLFTHIYFSQYLLLATPLLDPKIQQAIKQFPKLVLAGACLPDLAVISKSFSTTHQWQVSEKMIASAETDEEIAIAVGYASHLFVDVIAHNHFVPAHEAKWLNKTIVTHIASEWAMDGHIAKHIMDPPHRLIKNHMQALTHFVAPHFKLHPTLVKSNLTRLANLDRLLRFSPISSLLLWGLKIRDAEFVNNLNYYLARTEHALAHFNNALKGARPNFEPELHHLSATELIAWRTECLGDLRLRILHPVDYYHTRQKIDM